MTRAQKGKLLAALFIPPVFIVDVYLSLQACGITDQTLVLAIGEFAYPTIVGIFIILFGVDDTAIAKLSYKWMALIYVILLGVGFFDVCKINDWWPFKISKQ